MRYMIIDVGSNTVKYDLFSVKDGKATVKRSDSTPVRLVSKIRDGVLLPEGLDLLCLTLNKYRAEAEERDCDAVFAFATACMRRLRDPQTTLAQIKRLTGITVRILSGEDEAACSFNGMLLTLGKKPKKGVMLDMGGGSTEIIFFDGDAPLLLHSCPFGALSVKNALSLGETLNPDDRARLTDFVRSFLPERIFDFAENGKTAVPVGGTAKAISKLASEFLKTEDPGRLSIDDFNALTEILCAPDEKQRSMIRQLCPDRYALMATGAAAYAAIFEALGTVKIRICRGGVREGYLARVSGEMKVGGNAGKEQENG